MADWMSTKTIFAARDFEDAVNQAAELIKSGGIVAFPTETVYGLGANAFSALAVKKIFEAKGRPQDNPLIVHIADFEMLKDVAEQIPEAARRLMEAYWPGPLSVILHKTDRIPLSVTAGLPTVAVRMPENQIAREIIRRAGVPIAAPSANRSGLPSPTLARHVYEDLCGRIPLLIDGGPCKVGVESTVVRADKEGFPVVLRPGGVTPEMIQRICGGVILHESVSGLPQLSGVAASPGMKYKHYAPRARVRVFEGDKKTVAKSINTMYHNCKENAEKALVFCADDCAACYPDCEIRSMGRGAEGAEAALFAGLRDADLVEADVVLFHYEDEMGLAVKNRIIRAAGELPQGRK